MSDKTTEMLKEYREKNLKLLKELKELRKEGKEREMRRIDKLRAMSVEDVAKLIYYSYCNDYCKSDCNIPHKDITSKDCLACVVKWLNEKIEIKEGEVN